MALIDYAKDELRRIRTSDEPDEMQDAMDAGILKLVETFAEEGHSGFSAAYAVGIIEKLLRFEPLTPLTGADDEWGQVDGGDDMKWQSKRCPHVFKRADGTAYDIEAVIFREPDGCCYTGSDSHRDITFPYTPTREYVDVPAVAA